MCVKYGLIFWKAEEASTPTRPLLSPLRPFPHPPRHPFWYSLPVFHPHQKASNTLTWSQTTEKVAFSSELDNVGPGCTQSIIYSQPYYWSTVPIKATHYLNLLPLHSLSTAFPILWLLYWLIANNLWQRQTIAISALLPPSNRSFDITVFPSYIQKSCIERKPLSSIITQGYSPSCRG